MAKKHNKEPALTRTCPDGTIVVSREWVGWNVMYNSGSGPMDIESILCRVRDRINASGIVPAGKEAHISFDGRAIVTFVDKEVVE